MHNASSLRCSNSNRKNGYFYIPSLFSKGFLFVLISYPIQGISITYEISGSGFKFKGQNLVIFTSLMIAIPFPLAALKMFLGHSCGHRACLDGYFLSSMLSFMYNSSEFCNTFKFLLKQSIVECSIIIPKCYQIFCTFHST